MRLALFQIFGAITVEVISSHAQAIPPATCAGIFLSSEVNSERNIDGTKKISHQYVNLVHDNPHLSENPKAHEFKFIFLNDRVVIETLGAFAETAEGRKVFPPVEFAIRRPWRAVVNSYHRLVMVMGSEPLILSYDQIQGWRVLNPENENR